MFKIFFSLFLFLSGTGLEEKSKFWRVEFEKKKESDFENHF